VSASGLVNRRSLTAHWGMAWHRPSSADGLHR
jgi:hypothetical protein